MRKKLHISQQLCFLNQYPFKKKFKKRFKIDDLKLDKWIW